MKAPRPFKKTLIFSPASLSIEDMFDLHDGLGTALDVLSGMLSQPRFEENAPDQRVLHSLWQMVATMRQTIRSESLARSAMTDTEARRLVAFAAEEWVDGTVKPVAALRGLTEAVTRIVTEAEGSS